MCGWPFCCAGPARPHQPIDAGGYRLWGSRVRREVTWSPIDAQQCISPLLRHSPTAIWNTHTSHQPLKLLQWNLWRAFHFLCKLNVELHWHAKRLFWSPSCQSFSTCISPTGKITRQNRKYAYLNFSVFKETGQQVRMLSSKTLINRANLTPRRALLPRHLLMLSQLWPMVHIKTLSLSICPSEINTKWTSNTLEISFIF